MPLFRKAPEPGDQFRKNEVVIATEDLRGVPEGTTGKVKLINGVDWIRYWVFFDNGVQLGSVDGSRLVRPQHWRQFKIDREQRLLEAEEAALRARTAPKGAVAAEATGDTAEAAAAGGGEDPNAALRAMVGEELLARSAAARARLTGG